MEREFLAADVECIESVGAIGAVLHNIGCTRHSLSKLNSALVGTNSLAADLESIDRVQ